MPELIIISFKHHYYKLAKDVFSTLRGKAQFKKLKVGQTVTVEQPHGRFNAIIQALELRRIRDIPVEFLKADGEYPGCTISTREQFIHLLNSFRAPYWAQVAMDSEMTIITLKKI